MSSVVGHPRSSLKHLPTLQPHIEDELGGDEYEGPSTSSGGVVRQHSYPIERYNHQQRIQPTSMWSYPPPTQLLPGSSTRNPMPSSTLIAPPLEQHPISYYQEDEGTSSDDDTSQYEQEMAEFDQIIPATKEERERLEWQTMLRSVLDGDVLSAEKTRIGIDKESTTRDDHGADYRKNFPVADIWLGARARIRCRNIEEERKRVEHRRLRVGEGLVRDVLAFKYDESLGPPKEQVNSLLRRLDAVEAFYPSIKAMLLDKPAYAEVEFRKRIDAMISWVNLAGMIRHHYALLQKWTGSQTLDVIAPNTNAELPLVARANYARRGPNDCDMVDATTFVERILKEDSLVQIFKKRTLVDIGHIISRSNENYSIYGHLYKAMNLSAGIDLLRELLVFPTTLMHASLRVRLDYANKVKDMDLLRIDQMLDDFTISIQEACKRKFEYEDLILGSSILQHCLRADYDDIVLEAVTTFFGLLQRKLKSVDGIRGTHFKETEFLEAQSDLLNDVAAAIDGGSILVAEQLWKVMVLHRLIVRVTENFEKLVNNPVPEPSSAMHTVTRVRTTSTDGEGGQGDIVGWYARLLDNVRVRYRRLRNFTKVMTGRFSNSAEYSVEDVPLEPFINHLVVTGHFLLFSDQYQEEGVFIIADPTLLDRHEGAVVIIQRAFRVQRLSCHAVFSSHVPTLHEDDMLPSYILIFRPAKPFIWHGTVVYGSDIPHTDLDIKDSRIRLVADGGHSRLSKAKKRFTEYFTPESSPDERSGEDDDGGFYEESIGRTGKMGAIPCVIEQQAHIPLVNREVRKVVKATNRLASVIMGSADAVKASVKGMPQYQELLESWFIFASENAHQVNRHLDHASRLKFNRSLTQLGISWVSFICDDCDATDRKTFRWAVNALEFARKRVGTHVILDLPGEEFALLRKKVAMCMSLLIRHFDILGARSTLEAKRERERQEEIRRQQELEAKLQTEDDAYLRLMGLEDEDATAQTSGYIASACVRSVRMYRDRLSQELQDVDGTRSELEAQERLVGRVLDDNLPEDRSLFLLASSHLNVSIRWQQGKFIGGGAFGSVYLASNMDTGALMAVKEIRFQDVSGVLPNLFKQIKDELNVMEMLRHPNIVEYYGIEVHRDRVYIFEEYCGGGSLAALLELGRIEDETVIQLYALQMLEGLNYLHIKGIVHRDIKPDNILLDHRGVIKFVDFGAAKILARNRTMNRSRIGGATMNGPMGNSLTGTPMYMSPEVIKNDKPGRHGAMDIWSMGCVLLEAATGHKPWSNLDNEWAIMFHIGVATKHPPLPEPGQLSPLGVAFIRDCLNIDAYKRPTAAELLSHAWILQIKDKLREDEPLPHEHVMEFNGDFHDTIVVQQAASLNAAEVDALSDSPPLHGDLTPTGGTPIPTLDTI